MTEKIDLGKDFQRANLDDYLSRLIEARTIAAIVPDEGTRKLWGCIADGYQRAFNILNLKN